MSQTDYPAGNAYNNYITDPCLSEYILCRVGSPTIVQRARLSAPILSHLLLGRQGLLVRIHSLIHYIDDHYAYAAFL